MRPGLEVSVRVKHGGQEEVEQIPQLAFVVLQRRACEPPHPSSVPPLVSIPLHVCVRVCIRKYMRVKNLCVCVHA